MSLQKRISELVSDLCDGMHEREEIIAVSLLAALCGQNTFLYGPPGTAKSLISRRVACAFDKPAYFEYLMNRFSTPEEVFGPISVKALKDDKYVRKTDSYLPKAEFAFLDEIWKSSPAILNTLLTLINEHIFRNGEIIEKSPLKALFAASNETPDKNQGLDALYDRFIVRLMVKPIQEQENFNSLINSKPTEPASPIPMNLAIKQDEWSQWREKIHDIKLSKETITVIHLIRDRLEKENSKLYVSDRRWQRAAILMKAAAFFNDRQTTNHSDAVLLQHCLWTTEDDREIIADIVATAIKETGFTSEIGLARLDLEKERLGAEINQELFHQTDVYDVVGEAGRTFFKLSEKFSSSDSYYGRRETEIFNFFIPSSKMHSKDKFKPVDKNGNPIESITCEFDKQGSCSIRYEDGSGRNYAGLTYKPKIIFHKNDKKSNINNRLITSLVSSVEEIRDQLTAALADIEARFTNYAKELATPFAPKEKTQLALTGINEQITAIRLRIKDCERLEALCQ